MNSAGEARRKRILEFITAFIDENKYSPSYLEIADAAGLSSTDGVFHHLRVMREEGVLGFADGVSRSVRVLEVTE